MEKAQEKIKYDTYSDVNYPIQFLYKALWILGHREQRHFWDYVKEVDMPSQDIERVLNKHKYNTDPEFKAKIQTKIRNINKMLKKSDLSIGKEVPF